MDKNKPDQLTHSQALAYALQFTESDLIANQAGILSDTQRSWLTENHRVLLWSFEAWGLFGIAFSLILTGIILLVAIPPFFLLSLLEFYLAYRLMAPLLRRHRNLGKDLAIGVVLTKAGAIQLTAQNTLMYGGQYQLRLEEQTFGVSVQSASTFKNGDPYRLYYLPVSNLLLSAEWLHADQPFHEDSDGQP